MVEYAEDGAAVDGEEPPVRFVRDFVDLDLNWESAALQITQHPSSWLGELLTGTQLSESAVQARMDLKAARIFGASVLITLASPSRSRDSVLFPITWSPVSGSRLLPTFEGTLGISQMGSEISQLWIEGTYRAPLGRTGQLMDQAVFHRFADSSIRGFLLRLARSLTTPAKDN
ncbi:hypothetical protein [Ferrimicrobium acidiphilum]|uniref:Polyketide cyclase / dehydrase and lipid transport n=1 Tax=Ferrimicrobium acidiphilum DSM 19497 TaxID=1121877 RepID=A0A0D8FXL4_9ACTN|nr:hypothetical protein [Ferrimicrobium acidiphilum]KJE77960.1 hypothetical protein FEAC_03320 [Ferrimicrobium acidiphilum DSM 19497]MCL5052406.1 hypothetical protein [Gammaproteobacteria bacterium]